MFTLITISLSLLIFVIYIGTAIAQFGLPWSISGTYYLYEQKSGKGWIFQVFMFFVAWTLGGSMLLISSMVGSWMVWGVVLAALVIIGLNIVAICPNYLDSNIYKIHMTGAGIAAISAFIWLWFVCWNIWYVPFIATIPAILGATFTKSWKKSRDWWLEIIIFSMVYVTALIEAIVMLVK